MNTDKRQRVERGSVSRSRMATVSIFKWLRVTDPRSVIRVYLCPSVIEKAETLKR
jgi:hypothetical protein